MVVFLIGFMGSGKTTLGEQLAKKIDYKFADLDKLIEKKESISVAKIFSSKGEEYFRNLERSTLKSIPTNENIVIATGGGAPCYFDNIEIMNQIGETIYLRVPVKTLANRLMPGKEKRPLIAGKSETELKDFLRIKLQEREKFYMQANHIIEGANINVNDIITLVFDKNI